MMPIVVLISGRGSNLKAIIDAISHNNLPCTIAAVISNNKEAEGLLRAERAKIPTHVLDVKDFPNQDAFEQALQKRIRLYHPELIVLAGFMLVLSPRFVSAYRGKIMNIHPSLLPAYRGLHTHARVLAAKEPLHGATVHFATDILDGGPNIIQAKVPVYPTDTVQSLSERVLKQEHKILPLAIRWFAEKRLKMVGDQVFLDGQHLPPEGFQLDG